MNKEDFPGSTAHGEAWKFFCREMTQRQYSLSAAQNAWGWFLSGWLAKALQQDLLRGRR